MKKMITILLPTSTESYNNNNNLLEKQWGTDHNFEFNISNWLPHLELKNWYDTSDNEDSLKILNVLSMAFWQIFQFKNKLWIRESLIPSMLRISNFYFVVRPVVREHKVLEKVVEEVLFFIPEFIWIALIDFMIYEKSYHFNK